MVAPVDGATDEFPLPDPNRPLSLYYGQVAVDLGLLSDDARRQILQTQRSSLLRRTFRETAIALRLLSPADADAVIVGSALSRILETHGTERDVAAQVGAFVGSLKQALRERALTPTPKSES